MTYSSKVREYYDTDGKLIKTVSREGFVTTVDDSPEVCYFTDETTKKFIMIEKDPSTGKFTGMWDTAARGACINYSNGFVTLMKGLTFTYDENGRIKTGTDGRGVTYFTDTYDDEGRVIKQTDGEGNETLFEYGEDGVRTVTNRNGDVSTRVFNDDGLLVSYSRE